MLKLWCNSFKFQILEKVSLKFLNFEESVREKLGVFEKC